MAANPDDPTIALNCQDQTLPAGVSAADCYVPERNYGPIRNLYYTRAPFAAPPTALEIARRLALFGTAPTDPEAMVGPIVAQVSLTPATAQVDRINGVDYPKPTDLSFAVTIFDTNQAQYAFMRSTQKGGTQGYFYGVDGTPYWVGGQSGLTGEKAILSSRFNWPADETALQTITGTITGKGFFDPKRVPSPVPVV
ncbi:hypothetical protein BEN47_06200 [Hymenobacter lapidarius]|uniref:Uncharacterized protein n=1 Tax=Hymenobacter lapidarius TaxID=1908237 RepID=A0A1G1SQF2_9BACT|nr:hypothetical protein [Hymenobacter lapidarius]OGX80846.1 hypothetical protein BEN47_06200 [Hymenobacter lapidarius]